MAILRSVEISDVENLQVKMTSGQKAIINELTVINNLNSTLGLVWVSSYALEFQKGLTQLLSEIIQKVNALEQMAEDLQCELDRMKEISFLMG